jgi:tRNA(Ile)-lysidine synthase
MGWLSKRFARALLSFPPLAPGETVLVALSGGPDSVCLFDLIREVAEKKGFHVRIAHLDHGFRPEAEEEARFVRRLADRWNLPATIGKIDVPSLCKARGLSKQVAAREARYAFLDETARSVGARWIALGHTANDQAETFLIRLLRGSGREGLGGIPPIREGRFIRPLLSFTREEILRHLRESGLPFVEDRSNADPAYLRSRIRHELLPMLARYNPRIVRTLCSEAEIQREESGFMNETLKGHLPGLVVESSGETALLLDALGGIHPSLARRAVRWAIERTKGDLNGIASRDVDAVLRLTKGNVSAIRPLPGGIVAERGYDRLHIRSSPKPSRSGWEPVVLAVPGESRIPELAVTLRVSLAERPVVSRSPAEGLFDIDRLSFPLIARPRRPADLFYPAGMRGKKKLQDFFVDRKVPRGERDRVPILISGGEILWVAGYRQDRRFAAGPATRRALSVILSGANPE